MSQKAEVYLHGLFQKTYYSENTLFCYSENKPLTTEGNWLQEIPKSSNPLCVAVDPASDYRWTPLPCSGPQAAAFICQMEGKQSISLKSYF